MGKIFSRDAEERSSFVVLKEVFLNRHTTNAFPKGIEKTNEIVSKNRVY